MRDAALEDEHFFFSRWNFGGFAPDDWLHLESVRIIFTLFFVKLNTYENLFIQNEKARAESRGFLFAQLHVPHASESHEPRASARAFTSEGNFLIDILVFFLFICT